MSDERLRAAVDAALQAHLARRAAQAEPSATPPRPPGHPSHARFLHLSRADGETACLIEPAVLCTHCSYCESYGH